MLELQEGWRRFFVERTGSSEREAALVDEEEEGDEIPDAIQAGGLEGVPCPLEQAGELTSFFG